MEYYIKKEFQPNFNNLVNAARNQISSRTPLYDHLIDEKIVGEIMHRPLIPWGEGSKAEKAEAIIMLVECQKKLGYDACSFERCIGPAMEGSGALGGHVEGCIKNYEDFLKYPWDSIKKRYFDMYSEDFETLKDALPEGMLAVGGVGNGVFECVQDIVGYMNLCFIKVDDPDLYSALFKKIGNIMLGIWKEFIERYGDIYCVFRFGDDLGFKTSTLLSKEDIIGHIVPQYKRIVEYIHKTTDKPFLLHSCGNIFDVMDEIINVVKIDAKHSNEDIIAPFSEWVERYGDKIGNFGGIDCDVLCTGSYEKIRNNTISIIEYSREHGGFAFGTGNSVPDYVPVDSFLIMNEQARITRGEVVL